MFLIVTMNADWDKLISASLPFKCSSRPSLSPPANKCPDLSIKPANLILGSSDNILFENSSAFIFLFRLSITDRLIYVYHIT